MKQIAHPARYRAQVSSNGRRVRALGLLLKPDDEA